MVVTTVISNAILIGMDFYQIFLRFDVKISKWKKKKKSPEKFEVKKTGDKIYGPYLAGRKQYC